MGIATQMWLSGFVTWFMLRTLDALAPHNAPFNAMLTLVVVLLTFARWCERRLGPLR